MINPEFPKETVEKAKRVLKQNKIAIFIVAYNAEKNIYSVLKRIPKWIAKQLVEIYIIDDSSTDTTLAKLKKFNLPGYFPKFQIFKTPYNLGYGGNQKMGYHYALQQNYDIVILLHGDGQYAPEYLPLILAEYADEEYLPSAVFGSRFAEGGKPLKGGMPLYKWFGNKILTKIQNKLASSSFSEMHSGYRSYRCKCLECIPFSLNSNDFHFDAEIILQFLVSDFQIKEVPIPTYYGDEVCYVNGFKYAWNCIKSFIKFRLMNLEIFYDPKFDIPTKNSQKYLPKKAKTSLHYYIRNITIPENARIADIGGGNGNAISIYFANKNHVDCVDLHPIQIGLHQNVNFIKQDLNQDWEFYEKPYKLVFALDIIEHFHNPEKGVRELFKSLESGGTLYASTGNVAYFIIRLMLLFGKFNYGRKGILDMTHTRLMTINSFRRLLENTGFIIEKKMGFPPPIKDLYPDSKIFSLIDWFSSKMAKIYPSLFAFSFLLVCKRPDSIKDLQKLTFNTFKEKDKKDI